MEMLQESPDEDLRSMYKEALPILHSLDLLPDDLVTKKDVKRNPQTSRDTMQTQNLTHSRRSF